MIEILWQLQITFFLIEKYGYSLLNVVDENNVSNKNDIWLINKKNKYYSLIRVSFDDSIEEEYMSNVNNQVGKLINNKQDYLNIYTIKPNDNIKENSAYITIDGLYGKDILNTFKGINLSLTKPDNILSEINNMNQKFFTIKKDKKIPIVTYSIMIVCFVLFLLIQIFSKKFTNGANASVIFGAYYRPLIMAKEYFRLFISSFIHIEYIHFMVNMFSLYNLGKMCEDIYGKMQTFIIIILSSLFGNIITYLFTTSTLVVGISGGIYGLFGAVIVYYIYSGVIKKQGVFNSLINTIVINIFINFIPNIAVFAHLGGLIMGALVSIIYINNKTLNNLKFHIIISTCILFLLSFYGVFNMNKLKVGDIYVKTDFMVLNNYRDLGLNNYAKFIENNLLEIYNINR